MIAVRTLALTFLVGLASAVGAAEPRPVEAPLPEPSSKSVAELTALVRESVVVISHGGRDRKREGIGSGFVISPDGLIATNLHVIGEARPITVQMQDGRSYDVQSIHATDRATDLALIRIDAKDLPALELGDSGSLQQGQEVVAIGNPRGLRYSVVTGVVSGIRELDGMPLIQLAMPIEQGNSGGPLLDRQGRVHGILTLKSLVTRNLGFAVAINALKPLLEKPNPVPIERWLTIGALDPRDWTTLFGARWRQRAGRILVEGEGDGFGGRSLCLSTQATPGLPFEIAVTVKLDDESGAAGLVFRADGDQKHYGFYPSGGGLRLSRFDGPDVFSWRVHDEVRSPQYRPGEWNRLKVRLDDEGIHCFVNDELVIESDDSRYTAGRVGLAKFRDTKAEFKHFRIAKEIPSNSPDEDVAAAILAASADLPLDSPPGSNAASVLLPHAEFAGGVLRDEAKRLEQRAERLRQLARTVHEHGVRQQLVEVLQREDEEIDLLRATLLVAKLDNEELDIDAYIAEVERMAQELREQFPAEADDEAKLAALDKLLFETYAFHGSRTDYYNRSNSYLNEVIDDREGLPILLSVLYMETARRAGLNVVGVGLPGHFVVRFEPEDGEPHLIDPFDRGARLTREQAAAKVLATSGRPLEDVDLRAATRREIVARILQNLLSVARDDRDAEAMLRYTEMLVALEPSSGRQRFVRAVLRLQTGRHKEALADANWLLEHEPDDVDLSRVRELRDLLQRR